MGSEMCIRDRMQTILKAERISFDEKITLYSNNEPFAVGWHAGTSLWNGTQSIGFLVTDNGLQHRAASKPLIDLLALYALTVVMVTNDSGPAHFAAASGLPTIVLFGPETPNLYRPLGNSIPIYAGLACSPCVSASNHRKSACDDNVCMRAISVEQVFAAVTDVLAAPTRAS